MKVSAIIRIVIYAIVLIILLAVLWMGIGDRPLFGHRLSDIKIPIPNIGTYEDAEKYVAGAESVPAEGIQELVVDWASGSVEIQAFDGTEIQFSEQVENSITGVSSGDSLAEEEQLHWLLKDEKLRICYRKPSENFISVNVKPISKHLVVKVPRDLMLDELDVDTASGDVTVNSVSAEKFRGDAASGSFSVSDATCEDMDIDAVSGSIFIANVTGEIFDLGTTSGDIQMKNVSCQELDTNSTSGSLTLHSVTGRELDVDSTSGEVSLTDSAFDDISMESISGSLTAHLTNCPDRINTATTSGSVTLFLPENPGFTAFLESASGELRNDFPSILSGGKQVYENGAGKFSFDSVSGSVSIHRQ